MDQCGCGLFKVMKEGGGKAPVINLEHLPVSIL